MKKQIRALYKGIVQGVGFRFTAREIAHEAGVNGWVKNLPDGRVEIVAEAEEETLQGFLTQIQHHFARCVQDVDVAWQNATGEFRDSRALLSEKQAMPSEIKHSIEKLRQQIRHHDYLYYVLSQPEISDKEYDDLMRRLKSVEDAHPQYKSPDSPTVRLSGGILEGFETIRHRQKMLSLITPTHLRSFGPGMSACIRG